MCNFPWPWKEMEFYSVSRQDRAEVTWNPSSRHARKVRDLMNSMKECQSVKNVFCLIPISKKNFVLIWDMSAKHGVTIREKKHPAMYPNYLICRGLTLRRI